ncbi:HAMP domain-containing sensor histidine kinase [Novosphingobium sp.]|uniref:sensor histidine kinase n=1 Tax=Novosphingobium sp. TaxID=1874826 RepID=UPI00262D3324|nr:HAMP domain-containing sensor histidine kinase [Novosphingobium sp.]
MDQTFLKAVSLSTERRRWYEADRFLLFARAEWAAVTNYRPISLLLQAVTVFIFVLWSLDCLANREIDWLTLQYPLVFAVFSLVFLVKHMGRPDLIPVAILGVVVFIDMFCMAMAIIAGREIFEQITRNLVYYTAPVAVANATVLKPRLALTINLAIIACLIYSAASAVTALSSGSMDLHLLTRIVGVVGFYIWFSLALFVALSLYMEHRQELVEIHHLVAEMERNQRLNEENSRIRDDLIRTQRVQMVDSMTSTMAHEVNQPIACANNFIQAAQRWLSRPQPDVPEALNALSGAQQEIIRVSARVTSVRRLMQRLSSEYTSIDLTTLLQRFDAIVRLDLVGHGITLALDIPDDEEFYIYGCEEELIQVLMNLTANATDALVGRPEPRTVTIGLAEADLREVELTVADTGYGVPPELLSRVFDRLFSTKTGGSGLGLSLSKRIVANHGGTIGMVSEPGEGTRVILRFPRAETRGSWGALR